jgi:hypothetical protein
VTVGQLVQHVKRADTHRDYGSIISVMIGYLGKEAFWNVKYYHCVAFECLYVCLLCLTFGILLCLHCTFNILNQVNDFCKSSCEHYDDIEVSPTLCLCLWRCWTIGVGRRDTIRRELYRELCVIRSVINCCVQSVKSKGICEVMADSILVTTPVIKQIFVQRVKIL